MAVPAYASAEQINSFDSLATLSKSNVLTVKETIVYDFGSESRHGIYRTIPTDYPTSNNKHYYVNVALQSVTGEDGISIKADESSNSGSEVFKIGDPNRTLTGVHTYVVTYTISPIITAGDKGQLLNFNVTGNDWQVPILKASSTLVLPEGVTALGSACYTGPAGSAAQDCKLDGTTAATNGYLPAGDGLTVLYDLPAGTVSALLTPSDVRIPTGVYIFLAALVVSLLTLVIWLWIVLVRKFREKRRKDRQTVIAQYEAPKGQSPGDIGYLIDDKGDMVEITATLIDLAVRGYIKIEQTRPKSFLKSARYKLTKLKPSDGLARYESTLFNALFTEGEEVELQELDRTAMAAATASVHKELKRRLTTLGYYSDSKKLKGVWEKAVQGGRLTDEGAKAWAQVAGLKLYLSVAEKDRLKFTDAPERTPERFNKLLPYAIALGVEKEWAKQFEGIDVEQSTTWYTGNYASGFLVGSMVDDLGGGFSSAVASSFVVASSSSSGGSSGGGFGGGGGGSW